MFISLLVSSIIQVLLFTAIPWLYWIITKRKVVSFRRWIGLYRPVIASKGRFFVCFIGIVIIFSTMGLVVSTFLLDSKELANAQFYGLGHAGLLSVFIYSFIQTSLSEEILFRGFLHRIIAAKWGFYVGNIVQAVLFGVLHGVMLLSSTELLPAIIVVVITGGIGFSIGIMNEKLAGGSIVPGWVLHGVTNVIASVIILYA